MGASVDGEYLKELIVELVNQTVTKTETRTKYRKPLITFADAHDEDFLILRRDINPRHKLPRDVLSNAMAVVSFFIPFAEEVVIANREKESTAEEWAIAYAETNRLIGEISEMLVEELGRVDVRAAWEPPTHLFDRTTLTATWSHKSVAKIAGLGSFGLHQMIITDAGCAGRLGSLVIEAVVTPTPKREEERCLYYVDGSCATCVKSCPNGTLTERGLDRQKCWEHILEIDRGFSYLSDEQNLVGPFDVCGKCATGPCALKAPV